MPSATADIPALDEFFAEGYVRSVVSQIRSGKEATAYLCRAGSAVRARYVVAKVYHERNRRNFANDAVYQAGRVILNGQVRRAVAARTETGRRFQGAMWVDHEYETLVTLFFAGANVPEPYACTEEAILLGYAGDGPDPAPQLQQADLEPPAAERIREILLWNVECFLANNIVHGDLSAYNVLLWRERPVIIDFPQAVDPRFAPAARTLLERDLKNLSGFFRKYGLGFDHAAHAADLWDRFERSEL